MTTPAYRTRFSPDEPDSPLTGWGTPDADEQLRPFNYSSPRLQASAVVKSGPGKLFGLTVTNTKASTQYVQIFDASTLPAEGAVPVLAALLPASDALGLSWLPARTFLTGCVVCNSSTQGTKTLGSADCLFDVQFV